MFHVIFLKINSSISIILQNFYLFFETEDSIFFLVYCFSNFTSTKICNL